ncbi:DegT/DnrJ/EryC1/StrS family aminotransferase, partial [Candidatus Sumerlaeota bacterium]|nr:DegT/DnrJ/EryC1/StrS family aminotransferase [Candidatus Sumerlaeota bacterium]
MKKQFTRREFFATSSAATAMVATPRRSVSAPGVTGATSVPAILGGQPIRTTPFHRWPVWREGDEQAVLPVLRSGVWSRSKTVTEAERKFAELMGARYCLATTNGTNALITSVRALGIGAGDEVITT